MSRTTSRSEPSGLRARLPLLAVLLLGALVWKGGFGLFATSRDVTWRIEVPYADVRRVELEIFSADGLVRREERITPTGLSAELTQQLVLRRGPHRASARVWVAQAQAPKEFRADFDPGDAAAVLLEPTQAPRGPGR